VKCVDLANTTQAEAYPVDSGTGTSNYGGDQGSLFQAEIDTIVPDMPKSPIEELTEITDEIVSSDHPRKIIVAGAGAGKTTTFGKLLASMPAASIDRRLVVTFLGGLRRDLEGDLGDKARVQTFHGYCFSLLKQRGDLRVVAGFSDDLAYEPRIGQLIKSDWAIINGAHAVAFVPSLRKLEVDDVSTFFLARGSY
jgi:superfamily I DNA/RNA helicase